MQNKLFQTILVITFSDFLMFYEIFLSLQVKPIVIVSNKPGIYELPHEFSKNLRPRILKNYEILRRSQIFIKLYPSAYSSSQNENFVNTRKNIFKNWKRRFPAHHYFTLTLRFVSYILSWIVSGNNILLLIWPRPLQTWFVSLF